jgi:tetratricopeptide (TPR) repeat protein
LHEGQVSNAVAQFDQALAIMPEYPEAYYNLGRAFLTNHQPDVALECLQKAAALAPDVAQINFTLGETLLQQGRTDAAREYLQKALRLRPDFPEAHYKLANALVEEGRAPEAVAHYESALQLRQPFNEAANNLAWLLATSGDKSLRDGARAVELARQAERDSGGKDPVILGTLAAAYAEAGKYPDAVAAAERARQLALAQTNRALAATLETQLRQYQAGRPFRQ